MHAAVTCLMLRPSPTMHMASCCRGPPAAAAHQMLTPEHAQGQLLGVAISFLRNFGVLSGVSGALSALSAGVGSLTGDQQAQKERQEARQDRQITGLGQGLFEGGQAAGKGFLRGITGIATRPVQGFKQGGLAGVRALASVFFACGGLRGSRLCCVWVLA